MSDLPRSFRLAAALALAFLCPECLVLPAFDAPSWQVGDRWRVRRDMAIVVDEVGGISADLAIVESYDLTVTGVAEAGGVLAYHLTRSNPSVTGGGEATIPDVGTLDLTFGPASTTIGYEDVRLGDLALVEESFATDLVVRATIIIPLTIANARLALTTTPGAPMEFIDYPLEAENSWSQTGRQRLVGEFMVDFTGLLADQEDIFFPFDAEVDTAATWSAEPATATTIRILDAVAASEAIYDATFERISSRTIPGLAALGIESIAETVQSATLVPRPSFNFTLSPPAAVGGTFSLLEGAGATGNSTLEMFMPGLSNDATPIGTASDGSFSTALAVPDIDDATPSNDDLGSHAVVVRNAAGEYRTRVIRRIAPVPVSGALVR